MSYRSVFRPGLFAGQVVVVTGGGSGIGRCTAHELAALGAHVVLVGRKPDKLAGGRGRDPRGRRRGEPLRPATSATRRRSRPPWPRIVAAARAHPRPRQQRRRPVSRRRSRTSPRKGWQTVVATNLTGGFLMARECYTQCDGRRTAARSSTCSPTCGTACRAWATAARRAPACSTSPRPRRCEWAPVRVNAVAPGLDRVERHGHLPGRDGAADPRPARGTCPPRRLGTEAEVSAAIVFLLSEAAAFVSGACLRVDGAAPNARRALADRRGGQPTPLRRLPPQPPAARAGGLSVPRLRVRASISPRRGVRRQSRAHAGADRAAARDRGAHRGRVGEVRAAVREARPAAAARARRPAARRRRAVPRAVDARRLPARRRRTRPSRFPAAAASPASARIAGTRCMVVVDDSGIEAGALQPMGLEKFQRAQQIALENRLPFVHLVESAGANLLRYRVEDFINGGSHYARLARLSAAGLPVLTIVHGSSTAGGAYMPGLSDYVVMVRDRARAFLAGPPLLKAATGEIATEEDLGGAAMHADGLGPGRVRRRRRRRRHPHRARARRAPRLAALEAPLPARPRPAVPGRRPARHHAARRPQAGRHARGDRAPGRRLGASSSSRPATGRPRVCGHAAIARHAGRHPHQQRAARSRRLDQGDALHPGVLPERHCRSSTCRTPPATSSAPSPSAPA